MRKNEKMNHGTLHQIRKRKSKDSTLALGVSLQLLIRKFKLAMRQDESLVHLGALVMRELVKEDRQ